MNRESPAAWVWLLLMLVLVAMAPGDAAYIDSPDTDSIVNNNQVAQTQASYHLSTEDYFTKTTFANIASCSTAFVIKQNLYTVTQKTSTFLFYCSFYKH